MKCSYCGSSFNYQKDRCDSCGASIVKYGGAPIIQLLNVVIPAFNIQPSLKLKNAKVV